MMTDLDYRQEISDLKRQVSRKQEIIELQDKELETQRHRVQQKNRDLAVAHNRINKVKAGIVERAAGTYITKSHEKAVMALQAYGPTTLIDLMGKVDFAIQTRLSELRRMGYVKSEDGGPRNQKIWTVVKGLNFLPNIGEYVEYGNMV